MDCKVYAPGKMVYVPAMIACIPSEDDLCAWEECAPVKKVNETAKKVYVLAKTVYTFNTFA